MVNGKPNKRLVPIVFPFSSTFCDSNKAKKFFPRALSLIQQAYSKELE